MATSVYLLAVHPKRRRRQGCLCCIPFDRLGRLETRCRSCFAFCRNTPTDRTPVPVRVSFLQDSVAPLSTTACLSKSSLFVMHSRVGLASLIRTRIECRLLPKKPLQISEDDVPALGGRVLSLNSLCAWHRGPGLLVRSASFKVHSCRVTHRQHTASVPVQHRRTRNKSRTVYPDEEHCQVKHQR